MTFFNVGWILKSHFCTIPSILNRPSEHNKRTLKLILFAAIYRHSCHFAIGANWVNWINPKVSKHSRDHLISAWQRVKTLRMTYACSSSSKSVAQDLPLRASMRPKWEGDGEHRVISQKKVEFSWNDSYGKVEASNTNSKRLGLSVCVSSLDTRLLFGANEY